MKKYLRVYLFVLSLLMVNLYAAAQEQNHDFEISKNLDIFSELYKQLDLNYVDDINPGELMKTGIDAMLGTLDPFTNYIPESKIEDYKMMTTGEYGGIGALIHKQGDYVVIAEPYEGFPAQKSGLIAGDKILTIDGQSAKGKSSQDVSKALKGEPGTTVTLEVERLNETKPVRIELKREKVKIDNIPYYGMLNDRVGYIKLNSFTQNAGKEVQNAFTELEENNDLQGLVFDLRGNGGGLLNEAVNIVNIFVDKGELVVSTKGKESVRNKSYYTMNKPVDLKIPLVFLVDTGSASASEIVSGAMQDLDRAVIMGQRTYGKGLVQNVLPLSYHAKVKVTVAKYYIPSGRCIQAIDYSHKDNEGYAHKVPDSLINEFETKDGRKVYDGGGIEPDVYIEPLKMSPITQSLFMKYIIFDYATKFYLEHDSIAPPGEFVITDEIYNDFMDYVQGREDFTYTTQSEKTLERLKKIAEAEDYLSAINADIDTLEKKLAVNKNDDMLTHRDEISEVLAIEIISRYYFQKGQVKESLDFDPEIKKAIELIEDQEKYSEILSPPSKTN